MKSRRVCRVLRGTPSRWFAQVGGPRATRPTLRYAILLLAVCQVSLSAEPSPRSYALLPAPERAAVPEWARPWRFRYARCDGGPVEVCKAFMSGWEEIRQPDAILPCANEYNDATIDMLHKSRLNWIWVTWSVGFSQESEAVQRRILAPFIRECQAAGIRVTAYLSLTNMFIDDMNRNVPESKGWMQVELDGAPRPYNAAKYDGRPTRIIACLNHPGWLEYSRKRIASAVAAGVDALFYDNCFHGCKCPLCREKFAAWTKSVYGQSLPVPGEKKAGGTGDTRGGETISPSETAGIASRAWQRFCNQTAAAALEGHRRCAESLRPGILVYCNAHQQFPMNEPLNAIFTEDGAEPGRKGEELESNIGLYKYLYAEGDGWKPIRIECGRRIHLERFAGPMPPRNQMLAVYEGAACQAGQQAFFEMNWTTKLALGDPDARKALDALATANRWLGEHEPLFAQTEPIAKTALVMPAWEPITDLVRQGKNFVVLRPKHLVPRHLAQFRLVVLAKVCFMTDQQARAVIDYVREGGSLIAYGGASDYDDASLRRRPAPALEPLWGKLSNDQPRAEGRFGKGAWAWYRQTPPPAELSADWRRLEERPLVAVESLKNDLGFNLARTWDGRRELLYLMNYGGEPIRQCRVTLNLGRPVRSITLHVPGEASRPLAADSNAGRLVVTLPELDLFAVLEAQ